MARGNPHFCFKNDFDDTALMTTSSSNTTAQKTRLLDKRPKLTHTTAGQTGSNATYIYAPTDSPSIGRIIILGSNWQAFTITYDSGTAFSTAINVTNQSGGDFYFEFDNVTITADITITVTSTSPGGGEKTVGQIIFTRTLYTLPNNWSTFKSPPNVEQTITRLSSGRFIKNVIDSFMYSFNLHASFIGTLSSNAAEIALLETMFDENDINPIFFIPRPDTTAGDWDGMGDHVIIDNGRDIRNFSNDQVTAGLEVNIRMSPAGGT